MTIRTDKEALIALADKRGWHNYRDLGFGPQPIARYIGDGLGAFFRSSTLEGDDGGRP